MMTGNLTEKQRKLKSSLYAILNDSDFVVGIGSTLRGDDEVQEMLDFIDSKKWSHDYDLFVKAIQIANARKTS